MCRLIRSFLLSLSLLLACPMLWAAPTGEGDASSSQYNLLMQARGHELTGIWIMETSADGSVVGTLINEFGVKAFDFLYSGGKAQVQDVVGPLDRWYIRRVLRKDITFILSALPTGQDATLGKRRLVRLDDGAIRVENARFHIRYTLTPLTSD